MHFLLLVWGVAFVWLPVRTHRVFEIAYQRERLHIAIDNFGIRVGQGDRALLAWIGRLRARLALMEKAHHVTHACAVAGVPKCITADKLAERAIRLEIARSRLYIETQWKLSVIQGRKNALGERICFLRRAVTAPIRFEACSFCRMQTEVYVEEEGLKSTAAACQRGGTRAGIQVVLERTGGQWQYRLTPAP